MLSILRKSSCAQIKYFKGKSLKDVLVKENKDYATRKVN